MQAFFEKKKKVNVQKINSLLQKLFYAKNSLKKCK